MGRLFRASRSKGDPGLFRAPRSKAPATERRELHAMAIELKDVREIIENSDTMTVPGVRGYSTGVINLRGEVVPVVNLRSFFGYECLDGTNGSRLIICSAHDQTVALEVDQIVTIYKQEQYHNTPSLNKQLQEKKDTVDRLIEYINSDDIKEHVLVVNAHNLIRNHLHMETTSASIPENDVEIEIDEHINLKLKG